jgi:uncharacterized membrane protein YcfT
MTAPIASRVDWVDAAKGICIVFVVMMHSVLGVEKAVGETGWMGHVVAFAQPFRMPDFFLISGLFLARVVGRDLVTFLDRRVVHFLYFYVLWLTIQFAAKAPGMVAEDGLAATAALYLASLAYEPFGTLWFIWILPVFALVVRWTRGLPVPAVLAAAAVLEAAPILTGYVAVDEFAARFVYFYAGYAFAPAIFALADRVAARPAAAFGALLAWAVVNGAAVATGIAALPVVSLVLGFLGAGAVVTAAVLVLRVAGLGRLASLLGTRSIVVYLAFFLPMAATRAVLLKTGMVPDVGTMGLIVTVAGVAVPFAMKAAADRIGARFLFERPALFRLDARRRGSAAVPAA